MTFWLVNSGHFDPLLLTFGVISVAGVVYINRRLERIDGGEPELPVLLSPALPRYLLRLLKDIIVSNIEIVGCIWKWGPGIHPTVIRVPATQKNETVRVIYANSITLTPGTVTLAVRDEDFLVHALTKRAARDCLSGAMDREVSRLEG